MGDFGALFANYSAPIVIGASVLYIGLILLLLYLVRRPLTRRRETADNIRLQAGLQQDKAAKAASEKAFRDVSRLLLWINIIIAIAAFAPFIVGGFAYLVFDQRSIEYQLNLASIARVIATIGGLLGIALTYIAQGMLQRAGNLLFDRLKTWLLRLARK